MGRDETPGVLTRAVREFHRLTVGPWRLRRQIFSPKREFRRIERRRRRVLSDPEFVLNRWESHQPVMIEVLERMHRPRVVELGAGYASTPIVLALSGFSLSLETDAEWLGRFTRFATHEHRFEHWQAYTETEWNCPYFDEQWDVAFVDNAPFGSRQSNLLKLAKTARYIVCHDTEECFVPAGSSYGWDFSSFRYAWTYDRFASYTTVVSNFEPVALGRLGGIEGHPPPRSR